MIIIELDQGSDEWLKFRQSKIGASDSSTILGINPYTTPLKLWGEKLGLIPGQKTNPAMQRGHDLEEVARDKFNQESGIVFKPAIGVSEDYEWMMASFDGVSECGTLILEIKANGKKWHTYVLENGAPPPHHIPQLQHQMYIAGVNKAYYYSFDGENGVTLEVERDEEYIESLIRKELDFWKCICTFTPPLAA